MGIDVLLILNPFLFIEQHTSLARTCFFVSFVSDIPKIITLFCNYTNNSSFFLFVLFVHYYSRVKFVFSCKNSSYETTKLTIEGNTRLHRLPNSGPSSR